MRVKSRGFSMKSHELKWTKKHLKIGPFYKTACLLSLFQIMEDKIITKNSITISTNMNISDNVKLHKRHETQNGYFKLNISETRNVRQRHYAYY